MDISEAKRMVMHGKLAEYYAIPLEIEDMQLRIEEIRHEMAAVKSPRLDGMPGGGGKSRDEKLSDGVTKISMIEQSISEKQKRRLEIREELSLDDLSYNETAVLDAVFKYNSYYKAGLETGYSKSQIYRIMSGIYSHMIASEK